MEKKLRRLAATEIKTFCQDITEKFRKNVVKLKIRWGNF